MLEAIIGIVFAMFVYLVTENSKDNKAPKNKKSC
jgi:hypothetical protein